MYGYCCVPSCRNQRLHALFHYFPVNDEKRLTKWLTCINSQDLNKCSIRKLSRLPVCHVHFEKRFITHTYRLAREAYPSLFTLQEISTGIPNAPIDDIPKHVQTDDRHTDHTYYNKRKESTPEQENVNGISSTDAPCTDQDAAESAAISDTDISLNINMEHNYFHWENKPVTLKQKAVKSDFGKKVFDRRMKKAAKSDNRKNFYDKDMLRVMSDNRKKVFDKNLRRAAMKSDIVQKAMTQAELPIILDDPLMVDQNAMDVDVGCGDQHVTDDGKVGQAADDQGVPDHASDSDDDYHPSEDQDDYDDSGDEDDLFAEAASSTKQPTHKHTSKLLTTQQSSNLSTDEYTVKPDTRPADCIPPDTVAEIEVDNENVLLMIGSTVVKKVPRQANHVYDVPTTQLVRTYDKDESLTQYGRCRCCLKTDRHEVVNVSEVMECLNIEPTPDWRMSVLICSECSSFLEEARKFRDMALRSEGTLLSEILALDPDADISYASQDGHSGAKKRIVLLDEKTYMTPGPSTALHSDDFQEQTIETDDMAGEVTVPMELGDVADPMEADDGVDRSFSAFSNYTDFESETKEIMTDADIAKVVMSINKERSQFYSLIRENLITILECSTIIPFQSVRGVQVDCIYCEDSFKIFSQLRDHVEEKHKSEPCNLRSEALKSISQAILRADVSHIQCRLCDEEFTVIDNLVQHLVNIHDKVYHNLTMNPPHNILGFDLSTNIWRCITCEKVFKNYRKLVTHLNEHFGSFLCHQCGSKYLYPGGYSKHMQDHNKEKLLKIICNVCGETFKTGKALTWHIKLKHNDETLPDTESKTEIKEPVPDEEPSDSVYVCILCSSDTSFNTKRAAYMHRIGHLNNTREGPFVCELCDFSTEKKKKLRVHLKLHYEVMNFVCEICKKGFLRKESLSNHLQSHLELRYQCPLCDTTLLNRRQVLQHVKEKHPDVTVEF